MTQRAIALSNLKGENNMGCDSQFDDAHPDAKRKTRIRGFINTVVYHEYQDGVDENDLDAILLEFWKFIDECEVKRQR